MARAGEAKRGNHERMRSSGPLFTGRKPLMSGTKRGSCYPTADLARLKPACTREGTVTAGNASVVNDAAAAVILADEDYAPRRTSPSGSGVSLGHPIGATGAIPTVKALYELRRTGGRYVLVTMCIGGGQGIAAILERM